MERVDELRASARQRLYQEQQRLETLLAEAEGRLAEIEQAASGAVRTPEQLAEIASFRDQAVGIRRELRGVEREFRRDIDALAGRLGFVNIWLPPIFIGMIAAGVFFWRSRPRRGVEREGRP
jgi:ABC-2 type transport system permease protein